MANQPDQHLRAHLPIPEVPKFGLTTYDAKDLETYEPTVVLVDDNNNISEVLKSI